MSEEKTVEEVVKDLLELQASMIGKCADGASDDLEALELLVLKVTDNEDATWHQKLTAERSLEIVADHFNWHEILGLCEVQGEPDGVHEPEGSLDGEDEEEDEPTDPLNEGDGEEPETQSEPTEGEEEEEEETPEPLNEGGEEEEPETESEPEGEEEEE